MSTLSVDNWALTPLRLDFANQSIPGTFVANAGDAEGRGLDLTVTLEGEPLSLADNTLYLDWSHECGNQGMTPFTAVDASAGHFKVYYPAAMMVEGRVTARVSVYLGNSVITGSRNFVINVERCPVDSDQAMTDNDFSVFVQATIDLHELVDLAGPAVEAANAAAESANAAADRANAAAGDLTWVWLTEGNVRTMAISYVED